MERRALVGLLEGSLPRGGSTAKAMPRIALAAAASASSSPNSLLLRSAGGGSGRSVSIPRPPQRLSLLQTANAGVGDASPRSSSSSPPPLWLGYAPPSSPVGSASFRSAFAGGSAAGGGAVTTAAVAEPRRPYQFLTLDPVSVNSLSPSSSSSSSAASLLSSSSAAPALSPASPVTSPRESSSRARESVALKLSGAARSRWGSSSNGSPQESPLLPPSEHGGGGGSEGVSSPLAALSDSRQSISPSESLASPSESAPHWFPRSMSLPVALEVGAPLSPCTLHSVAGAGGAASSAGQSSLYHKPLQRRSSSLEARPGASSASAVENLGGHPSVHAAPQLAGGSSGGGGSSSSSGGGGGAVSDLKSLRRRSTSLEAYDRGRGSRSRGGGEYGPSGAIVPVVSSDELQAIRNGYRDGRAGGGGGGGGGGLGFRGRRDGDRDGASAVVPMREGGGVQELALAATTVDPRGLQWDSALGKCVAWACLVHSF